MKRVYLLLTLFITSFFFISLNEVKADTFNLSIPSSVYSRLNYNFDNIKEEADKYSLENDMYYFIRYSSGYPVYYYAYFFNEISNNIFYVDSNYINGPSINYLHMLSLDTSSNEFNYSDFDTIQSYSIRYNISSGSLLFSDFLYTNYKDFKLIDENDDLILVSDNCTYNIKNNDKFRSLYDYKLARENSCIFNDPVVEEPVEDLHSEEKEILSNYYSIVIEKINLLANCFMNNYIYLSIIGIFILIFIIELIFRRYI